VVSCTLSFSRQSNVDYAPSLFWVVFPLKILLIKDKATGTLGIIKEGGEGLRRDEEGAEAVCNCGSTFATTSYRG